MKNCFLINPIRAIFRLIVLICVALLYFFLNLLFLGKKKFFFTKSWSRFCVAFLGIKIHLKGTPPEQPFFVVANHVSYLDILLLWTELSGFFISKKELQFWPLLGWISKALGTLYIDRSSGRSLVSVNDSIRKILDKNEGVILFPEATSSDGKTIYPLKSSLLQSVIDKKLPVHLVYIQYFNPSDGSDPSESIAWVRRDDLFIPHFYKVLRIKSFHVRISFSSYTVRHSDRKVLAKELHKTFLAMKEDACVD